MRKIAVLTTALTVLGPGMAGPAAAETIKIALIDSLSGPAAGNTQMETNQVSFVLDLASREGWAGPGNTFELVTFDGKGSPQVSTQQLKNAVDQGIHYVVQGLSAAVGLALIDAVNRNNDRNPGKEVIYFNATNTAPEMTNEKCSFWHFRWDSNIDMKSAGLASYLAKDQALKRLYLINQNYATGQGIAKAIREDLKKSRPDIEIVGDDLHQMFQVKDFSPYVSKIKSSDAQAIVSGNWGADLNLLVKATKDFGLKIPIYSYTAQGVGTPTALAAGNVDNLYNIHTWNPNDDIQGSKQLMSSFKQQFGSDFSSAQIYNMIRMFSKAVVQAKTTEPIAVARALEGMKMKGLNGEVEMRKEDHQIIQPLFVMQWVKANGKDVVFDLENTGYSFKSVERVDPSASAVPSICQMKRPG